MQFANAITRATTFDSNGDNASDAVTTMVTNCDDDEGDGDEYTQRLSGSLLMRGNYKDNAGRRNDGSSDEVQSSAAPLELAAQHTAARIVVRRMPRR